METVFAVVFANYSPPELNSLWATRKLAADWADLLQGGRAGHVEGRGVCRQGQAAGGYDVRAALRLLCLHRPRLRLPHGALREGAPAGVEGPLREDK